MQKIEHSGSTYEIEGGVVYVIKTRHSRHKGVAGRTWRHRITSAPKIRKILKLAAAARPEPAVTDEMLSALSGPLPARAWQIGDDDDEPIKKFNC